MIKNILGKAVKVGKNIDTDQIYPGKYLAITDPKEIGKHCLEGVSESFSEDFPSDGIIVASTNFGCGSSREHAPIALINMGAKAVVAESFARIFYRNGINLGLPLIICKDISKHTKDLDSINIDFDNNKITINSDIDLDFEPFNEQSEKILLAGGIKPLMKERFSKEE